MVVEIICINTVSKYLWLSEACLYLLHAKTQLMKAGGQCISQNKKIIPFYSAVLCYIYLLIECPEIQVAIGVNCSSYRGFVMHKIM
jgi:hypothetical protein